MPPPTLLSRLSAATGLTAVHNTGLDAYLIILARATRMTAYGASSLILALFLAEIGTSDTLIGLFMALTLAGDVVLSLTFTLAADRKLGRRRTLLIGSCMMVVSGLVFVYFENVWILLLAAVVGVISATGGDFGPFRAVEESVLSELTGKEDRPLVLAWYVTTALLGTALGSEGGGRAVEWLKNRDGATLVEAYHGIFWAYVAAGCLNVISSLCLSERCELRSDIREMSATEEVEAMIGRESTSLDSSSPTLTHRRHGPFAQISRETLSVVWVLWALLMVDSLADGMVSITLTTYFLDQKFHLTKSFLGDAVSASYLASCFLNILSGPLAHAIGLVNTMVFTHLPSSLGVLFFPFPGSVWATVGLLVLRVALNPMDQAPRAALIAAVVRPEERTAVMGITSTVRTVAATIGPGITGGLSEGGRFWIAFVVAGCLRVVYDLGLFAMFINIQLHKYEPVAAVEVEEEVGSERELDGELGAERR